MTDVLAAEITPGCSTPGGNDNVGPVLLWGCNARLGLQLLTYHGFPLLSRGIYGFCNNGNPW